MQIKQVQQDAKARQDALDAYEAEQRKQVEAEWARKAEEVIQIQAELESIKAHYMARIGRNLEGVAREKATFNSWLTLKQQECQSMAPRPTRPPGHQAGLFTKWTSGTGSSFRSSRNLTLFNGINSRRKAFQKEGNPARKGNICDPNGSNYPGMINRRASV